MIKKLLAFALLGMASFEVNAQNATTSPYSQYGYGLLADQSNGAMVGMSGLSMGWREGNTVNFSNPASYSAVDSISMIFDAGLSLQLTNFKEGNRKLNSNSSSFDYLGGSFRLLRRVGVGFGVMPYTNVGYSYNSQEVVGGTVTPGSTVVRSNNTYSGEGGLHQLFLGVGVEAMRLKNTSVSVGVNGSYLWGDYTKSVVNSYSDTYVNTLSKSYTADVKSYKLDFGVQVQQRFSKKDVVTLGATYSYGHDMSSDPRALIISTNAQTSVADTTTLAANGRLRLPTSFGVGFVWNHNKKWRVGFDYKQEQWGSVNYPVYQVVNGVQQYTMVGNQFKNRQRYILGGEYTPNEQGRKWRNRVKYRFGLAYASPYLKINGQDGPKEYGVSAGVGLPIINAYNNRSVLNVSASWTRTDAKNLINENIFRINIGLTFNERWFAKWQVD